MKTGLQAKREVYENAPAKLETTAEGAGKCGHDTVILHQGNGGITVVVYLKILDITDGAAGTDI